MRRIFALLVLLWWQPADAALVATAGTNSFGSTGNVSSIPLNLPTSIAIGDLLLVHIAVERNDADLTLPSGWALASDDIESGDVRQYIVYRPVLAGDVAGAAVAFPLSRGSRAVAGLIGFRSTLTGRTVQLAQTAVNGTSQDNQPISAVSLTAANSGRLLRFFAVSYGGTTFGAAGNVTTHFSSASNSNSNGVSQIAVGRDVNAGSTGADTVTVAGNDALGATWQVESVLLEESVATPTTCLNDNFTNAGTFAQDWTVTSVGSTSFTPTIINGRLRLTDNVGNISTAASLRRIFPAAGNYIRVEFDHYAYPFSSGADGIAVTLSDAAITPQPGGFGGSLGYAQRSGINGFAGGWMSVGIDEYGNYSSASEGRVGGPGFRADSIALRGSGSGTTGYAYIAGTLANLNPGIDSGSSPGPGFRYRIFIDAQVSGQTIVTVDRDTGSGFVNLIPATNIQSAAGQAAIPANLLLSITGSTGGSRNYHEIGNLQVCAYDIQPVQPQIHHFRFFHDGSALTCEPETITVQACMDTTCSTLASGSGSVTFGGSMGSLSNTTQTLTNGSGVFQLRQTSAGNVTFNVSASNPSTVPFSQPRCYANGTLQGNCNLAFASAGLSFDVPNLLANKPSGAVRLRAVRNSGDATNSCVALFQNTTQNINFWSGYASPATGTRAVELRAGSGAGAFTGIAGASPGTAMPLSFNNNGETTVEARYQDAGQMALNARFTGSGTYAGLILNGSDAFVSTPAGFCVRGATAAAPTNYVTCTANFANCPILATVSNPFTLNIAAAAWQVDGDTDFCTGNGNTPNYAQNSLALSSVFGLDATQFAAAGTASNGVVAPATVNILAGSSGVVTQSNVTESEVGAFNFVVTPPALAYFGVTVPSGTSAILGRFIPHHFSVANGAVTNRSGSCAVAPAFTYLNEPLLLGYQINAMNNAAPTPTITQNYQGVFARLTTFAQTNTAAISVGPPRVALIPQSTGIFSASWLNGQGAISSSVIVPRTATPVGAYTNTYFGVAPTDTDSVTTTGFDLDTSAPADSVDRVRLDATATELRYGRLRLDSASGPVDLDLPLSMSTEYWTGSGFTLNAADTNCTTISNATAPGALSSYQENLSAGETTLSGSAPIVSGVGSGLQLSAPGVGNEGSVDVTLDITAIPWLWFDWNGDGTLDPNVTATASFGTYRGSDRVIYWLEQN